MKCDWCGAKVPDDYVLPVDGQGQPLPPSCRRCEVELVYSRANRLRMNTASSEAGKEN